MENAGSLDFLVKLASFGTAGVCILAIFFIGSAILKLPNDSPSWKAQLMKRFITACIIIAGITAFSGGLNAYFNRGKIIEADKKAEVSSTETDIVASEYEKLSTQYTELSNKVESLLTIIGKTQNKNSPAVDAATNKVLEEIKVENPKPLDQILDTKSSYIQRRQKMTVPDNHIIRK